LGAGGDGQGSRRSDYRHRHAALCF
jgi:hypothetical protein